MKGTSPEIRRNSEQQQRGHRPTCVSTAGSLIGAQNKAKRTGAVEATGRVLAEVAAHVALTFVHIWVINEISRSRGNHDLLTFTRCSIFCECIARATAAFSSNGEVLTNLLAISHG